MDWWSKISKLLEVYIYGWLPPAPTPGCFSDALLHNWGYVILWILLSYIAWPQTRNIFSPDPKRPKNCLRNCFSIFINTKFIMNLKNAGYQSFICTSSFCYACMCTYRCHFPEYTRSENLECWLLLLVVYTLPQPNLGNAVNTHSNARSWSQLWAWMCHYIHRLTQFIIFTASYLHHTTQMMAIMEGVHRTVV